jgi:hypothetical protein
MAVKVYKRIGLRRDRNLADLSDSTEALNNLLDTLIDDPRSTFISEDLDAIRSISSLGLSNAEYRQIIGSSEQFTDSNGVVRQFFPRITYQNRLDRFALFGGEPILNGGNGLTAKYYNPNQIDENSVNIFSGTPFKIDNFWENGNFDYTGKITPEAVDSNGGVEWEGYFIPTETGEHIFNIASSASFTFDFESESSSSYVEISRIGITTVFSGSGSLNTNSVVISASNTKYVAIGQSVSGSSIVSGSVVSSYDRSSGVVNLTPPIGVTYAVSSAFSGNLTFFKNIGQSTNISYSTYALKARQKYKIKFRYYIPAAIDATSVQRNINFDFSSPTSSTSNLRYTYLYSLDYDFQTTGKLDIFLRNSINTGGGVIGTTTNSSGYVKLQTSKKVDIKYAPKQTVNDIIKLTTTGTTTNGSEIISMSNTSGIEVGNFVFGTGIPANAKVEEFLVNSRVILDTDATASGAVTLTFVDHRGFVERSVGSGSAGSFTLSSGNTTNLKSNMIMIGSGVEQYTGITTTGSSTSFTITPSQTIGAGTTVYFYQSRGLINNALDPFCPTAQTRCLIVSSTTALGSTVIPVTSTTGISNGWTVQGFQFSAGTTVSSFTSNSITISAPTTLALSSGANFTVTNGTDDKTLCCPPTDTSPPFTATVDGLETVSSYKNLRVDSGNIVFDSITVGIANTITAYSSLDVSGSRLTIQTPSGNFKILCA